MFYMECKKKIENLHQLTNENDTKLVVNMLFYTVATDIRRRQTGQIRVTNNQLVTHSE